MSADDRESLGAVFELHGPTLWRALYAYAGGRRDIADDAVAEAFARALEHRSTIRSPLPWLYRIAFRVAAQELRRPVSYDLPASAGDVAPPTAVVEVIDGLRRLPPRERAALVMFYEADMPVRDIANLLGTSQVSIRVHLHNGRKRLERMWGNDG